MYRSYLLSHLCQHMGDWFVRIASILLAEEFAASKNGHSAIALSNLTLSRLLPQVLFSQVGGYVSDKFDRRYCMIVLDILAAIAALGYLVAIQYKSLSILYAMSALRSSLSSTYYPVTTGIVPLLIKDVKDLQLAVTLNFGAWGFTSIIGGLFAGFMTIVVGLQACYVIDFVTYILSAAFICWGVKGNFRVTPNANKGSINSSGYVQLFRYLVNCGFGFLIFSKCSASFLWGIDDIVNPLFVTVKKPNGEVNEETSSWHMGLLFSTIGAACICGPALVNTITDASKPYTIQRACLIGLLFLTGKSSCQTF